MSNLKEGEKHTQKNKHNPMYLITYHNFKGQKELKYRTEIVRQRQINNRSTINMNTYDAHLSYTFLTI